jgi:hypothetical protein
VREASTGLTAVVRYRFGESFVRGLDFLVPPELEVAHVEVRAGGNIGAASAAIGVRDWNMSSQNGQQRLHVDLTFPINGQVQATLELLPRTALSSRPALPTPVCAGAGERESFLAVRIQGWEASVAEDRGYARISEELFFREQWQPLRIDAGAQAPQFAFRRLQPDALLRLTLEPRRGKGVATQSFDWVVGAGRPAFKRTHVGPLHPRLGSSNGTCRWMSRSPIFAALDCDTGRGADHASKPGLTGLRMTIATSSNCSLAVGWRGRPTPPPSRIHHLSHRSFCCQTLVRKLRRFTFARQAVGA